METLKIGSKGETVKALQMVLGVKADGIFGKGTETMVKYFQAKNGLTPDGIVGAKTLAALGLAKNTKVVADFVIYDPLSIHISKAARSIKYIAIHYTAGGSSKAGSAKAVKKVFEKRSASADFCVDDKDIVQFNPDLKNYYCWAVGDTKNTTTGGGRFNGAARNANTVSIEICSNLTKGYDASKANTEGWYFTEDAVANAARLVKVLMQKYNVPIERVVRHYDITGKLCPGIKGWNSYPVTDKNGKKLSNNDTAWVNFKNRL